MFKPLKQQSQVLFFFCLFLLMKKLFMHCDSCLIATAFHCRNLYPEKLIPQERNSLMFNIADMWMDYLMEAGVSSGTCSGTLETKAARINVPNGQLDPDTSYIFVFKMNFKSSCNIGYNKHITNYYNII